MSTIFAYGNVESLKQSNQAQHSHWLCFINSILTVFLESSDVIFLVIFNISILVNIQNLLIDRHPDRNFPFEVICFEININTNAKT